MAVVDIQPPTNIYETFARLNYKPWYALAEFVDNSTQSFSSHRADLSVGSSRTPRLTIDIAYEPTAKTLVVRDDAFGMDLSELTRAMRISTPPPDTSGRSEFGMGMKTAACWFGPRWTVTTTQLGASERYRVVFDLEELSSRTEHVLDVHELPADPSEHGTTIFVEELRKPIAGRQIAKIKDLLTSMYRADLRDGFIEIRWRGAALDYIEPELWIHEREDGSVDVLRQPINTSCLDPATGDEHLVTGWVGVLDTMSAKDNGFSLLRRGRVIIGGPGEGWKPAELMGSNGSHSWKRLVGELHLDDFPVNFTKDGFAWDGGLEDALISALKGEVSTYKQYASNLRTRLTGSGSAPSDFKRAVEEMQDGVNDPTFRRDVTEATTPLPPGLDRPDTFDPVPEARVDEELSVPFPNGEMKATLYVKDEGAREHWMTMKAVRNDDIDILLNTAHPFVRGCLSSEGERVVLTKLALAVGIAEQQARVLYGDEVSPEEVRILMNTVLQHALK